MCFICKTIFSQNRPTAPVAAIIVLFNLIHLKCVHVFLLVFFLSMRLSQCLFMWIIFPIVVIIMMMMMMHHHPWTCIVIEINWGTIFNVLTFYPLSIWVSIEIGSLCERFVRFQFDFHFHRNRNLPTLSIPCFYTMLEWSKIQQNQWKDWISTTSRHSSHANRAILFFFAQRIHSLLFCYFFILFSLLFLNFDVLFCVFPHSIYGHTSIHIFLSTWLI